MKRLAIIICVVSGFAWAQDVKEIQRWKEFFQKYPNVDERGMHYDNNGFDPHGVYRGKDWPECYELDRKDAERCIERQKEKTKEFRIQELKRIEDDSLKRIVLELMEYKKEQEFAKKNPHTVNGIHIDNNSCDWRGIYHGKYKDLQGQPWEDVGDDVVDRDHRKKLLTQQQEEERIRKWRWCESVDPNAYWHELRQACLCKNGYVGVFGSCKKELPRQEKYKSPSEGRW